MEEILYCILAYLSGSVLYALLLGKPFNADPRKAGIDGNPGATNAFRAGGIALGTPVLLLDFLKGFVPVFLFFEQASSWQMLLAISPVLGHIFPVFYRFRGGKGIATTFGIWGALTYWVMPSILGSTFSAFLFFRHFYLFSLPDHLVVTVGMLHLAGWAYLLYGQEYFLIALLNLALLILSHRHEWRRKEPNRA